MKKLSDTATRAAFTALTLVWVLLVVALGFLFNAMTPGGLLQ